jgi:hypothetical protein
MSAKDLELQVGRQRAELYYATHPRSPSTVRQPSLTVRSGTWIALLGQNIEDGIVGFGDTVEAALRAFDLKYLNTLRPPSEALDFSRAA